MRQHSVLTIEADDIVRELIGDGVNSGFEARVAGDGAEVRKFEMQ